MRPCICVTSLEKKSCRRSPVISELAPGRRCGWSPGTAGGTPSTPLGPAIPEAGATAAARRALPRRTSPLRAGRCLPRHSLAPGRHHRPQQEENPTESPAQKGRSTRSGASREGGKKSAGVPPGAAGQRLRAARAPAPPAPARTAPLRRRKRRSPGVAVNSRAGSARSSPRRDPGERGSARPYLLCCAAGVGLGMSRGAAAASGGGVEVPGVVLVHGPRSGRGSRVPAFSHRHPPLPRRLPAPFSLPTSSALAFRLPTLAAEPKKKKGLWMGKKVKKKKNEKRGKKKNKRG